MVTSSLEVSYVLGELELLELLERTVRKQS